MSKTLFIKAEEVAEELGVSLPFAYKLIRKLNSDLEKRGFIIISGRVSREYYREKIYCAGANPGKGAEYGSV